MPHMDTVRRVQPPPMTDERFQGEIDAAMRADLKAQQARADRAFEAGVRFKQDSDSALLPRIVAWVSGFATGALLVSAMEMLR